VDDGVTGGLVNPEDPAAIARAVIKIAGDPDLARRLGEAGRAKAASLSWSKAAERVYRLIEKTWESGRPAG